jgi:hypothetical protein
MRKSMNLMAVERMRVSIFRIARWCTPIRLDTHRSASVNPCKRTRFRPAQLAVLVGVTVFGAMGDHAAAKDSRSGRSVEAVASRPAGDPILAIVSLHDQRITVYDDHGWIFRAPVSTGQKGRETPAGIFSVIQKDADHYSNLYDDAYMPHMQRITWSGIALHGGPLPGYPASHGCVRMPFEFAARLFEETPMGMRVIVAPSDLMPVDLTSPALFPSKPGVEAQAKARTADADEAARTSDRARLAVGAALREAARATVPVRVAENLKVRTEAQLAAAETALGSANSAEAKEQAENAKAKALAAIADLQMQVAAHKAELQPKLDSLMAAREAAAAAEAARVAAAEAARQAARELEPVSVLISRKTQRLYVRQGFEPVLESPVTILDSDRPIGTHVFTTIEGANGAETRWSVVSLDSGGSQPSTAEPHGRPHEPIQTNPSSARIALERIVIPQDVSDRIAGLPPRSSLIITDEALSSETGKGTDFVVLLSGEPQGGIKFRQRGPAIDFHDAHPRGRLPYWRSPFAGPSFTW